ncbi:MAG: SpoIIE family protein phosphatase [Planctomycetota bacterium]|jgi:serine phosphatase RsbU (regulator of sigma subunit)
MPESEDKKPKPVKAESKIKRRTTTVGKKRPTSESSPVKKPTGASTPVKKVTGATKKSSIIKPGKPAAKPGTVKIKKGSAVITKKTGSMKAVSAAKSKTGSLKTVKTSADSGKSSSTSTRKKAASSSKKIKVPHENHESSDSMTVKKKGMGLAAKFSIPVCILIAFAIGGWGYMIGKDYQDSMINDIKKTGVTSITILADLGRQMISVRDTNPGAWPVVVGIISREEAVEEFGFDLEKKIISLGYRTPAVAFEQIEEFKASFAINRNNKFKEVKDLVDALGFKKTERAKREVAGLRKKYAEIINSHRAANGGVLIEVKPYTHELNWSGMSDAPLDLFNYTHPEDASDDIEYPDYSNLMNDYIAKSGALSDFLKIKTGEESVQNEVLDAYIVDRFNKAIASASEASGNKIILGEGTTITSLKINNNIIETSDIQIDWCNITKTSADNKTRSVDPALTFSKEIISAKGSKVGNTFLAISARIIEEEKRRLQMIMGGVGLAAVFVAAMLCLIIAKRVTSPLQTLIKDMDIVAQGDLTHKTIAHSSDEIGAVATQFNQMTQKLLHAQAAEKEAQRIEDELERAREIQMGLLPAKIPSIKGLDIYATYHPAKEVGGDYYDFYPIDKEHLGIIVADVSGKGIPGSMVMGTTRTILRFSATANQSAADTLTRTNKVVAMDIRRGMFVTAMYVVLHARSHDMLIASAGHNPMAIYRAATKEVDMVNPNGIALGFDKGPLFQRTIKEMSVKLGKGDRVVLYTDGVVEAMNEENEEYTNERFIDFIKDNTELNSKEFVSALLDDLNDHKGNAEQHDDITIVTFCAK